MPPGTIRVSVLQPFVSLQHFIAAVSEFGV
jgi:hypothetical protein